MRLFKESKKEIDKRLLKIQSPRDLHKLPHVISDNSNYKAKDCYIYTYITVYQYA